MTQRSFTEFRAPGKLVLLGEYAVAFGYPGVVMAVDRHVTLSRAEASPETAGDDLVSFARREAAAQLGVSLDASIWRADSSSFSQAGIKLGLGSSAAVTAASVASVFSASGLDISNEIIRRKIWQVAHEAHNRFQGSSGSGIDVAAAVFGGIVCMEPSVANEAPAFFNLSLPPDLIILAAWTGGSASTPELLRAVQTFKKNSGEAFDRIVAAMAAEVEGVTKDKADAARWRLAARRYGEWMRDLGRAAGVDIVTPVMTRISEIAESCGGSAKPSGAGGGDMMLAFFPAGAGVQAFKRELPKAGGTIIGLDSDPIGVHSVPARGPGGQLP
ncbi:MAG: hypothetical protein C4523_05275 [Myxococcales bacterium]|nr:MAG: hypothetical protein C4523_05275 [Myxococcales bacterium]